MYSVNGISITKMLATALFIDFGESEHQPVDTSMELPAQFRDMEPLPERVKPEG